MRPRARLDRPIRCSGEFPDPKHSFNGAFSLHMVGMDAEARNVALRAAAPRWHVLLIGSLAIDLKPCCLLQPLLPCLAVKVPRLTGVSGLEIWIVETPFHRSNVSEATDAPNAG